MKKKSTWETKNVLITAMVNLVLLYGAEIWGADGTIKIRKAHLKIYKRLLLVPSNIPGRNAVVKETRITHLRWWTKLLQAA
jgi:hypothetical protein